MLLLLCLIGYDDKLCERVVAVANCWWKHCGNVANTTEADADRDDCRHHSVLLVVNVDDKPRIIFQ